MYNMLICDDEPYVLDLLRENIDWKRYGVRVGGTALNGQLGLNAFQMERFDIVLADIKMPLMSGVEMAKRMRETDRRVQIIFLTSLGEFEYAQSAVNIGACGYILKPFRNEELISAVQTAVARLDGDRERGGEKPQPGEQDENADFIVENVNGYIAEKSSRSKPSRSTLDIRPITWGICTTSIRAALSGIRSSRSKWSGRLNCSEFPRTRSVPLRNGWDMGIMPILSNSSRSITERHPRRFVTAVFAGRNSAAPEAVCQKL